MPPYNATPGVGNNPVGLLQPGVPAYAFGSKNTNRPTVRMIISALSVSSNVVTLYVNLVEGFIPAIGDLITVVNTATDSGAANVSNIALASVVIDPLTGLGHVTYAATAGNQAKTPDAGTAYVAVPEIAEACVVAKSQAFAIQNTIGKGYGISWSYECPSAPGAIAIQLEGAINDNDAEYSIIGTSQTGTGGVQIAATVPELVNFVRLNTTAASGGTSPTIIGKILKS